MSLMKYNRTPSLLKMFFDDPFTKDMFLNDLPRTAVPKANIKEDENKFTLELAIPGFTKEDIKVELEGKVLKIFSEMTEEHTSENEKVHLKEFRSRSFERSFTIPESVDTGNINADYTNGVLKLMLPKNDQARANAVRQIEIG